MKLSELFAKLKDTNTDPELWAQFEDRPGGYPLIGVLFKASIEEATIQEFNKRVNETKGPTRIVLVLTPPRNPRP